MSTTPVDSGCTWPIDTACFSDSWDDLDSDVQDRAIALASATLRRLTGYRVGGCPITVRPCKASCRDVTYPSYYDMLRFGGVSFWPHINGAGLWVNSCGCGTHCGCEALCEIALPPPVGAVYAVHLDGAEVPSTDYRADAETLVWVGAGECPWPACQDLSKPDTAVGTFSVTYLNAYPVDTLGAYAAGVLASEFAKACTGGKGCRLPANVVAISRQGVSMEIASGAFPGGMTGIREVDTYVALFNPNGLTHGATVWSPDLGAPRLVPTAWP
jgi:hypothetical protein